MTKSQKDVTILGIGCTSSSASDLLERVDHALKSRRKFFIVTPNPEIITRAQTDPELFKILNRADISLPDGMGLIFAARTLGKRSLTRIPGRIFMQNLFSIAHERKLKIYLLGSTQDTITAAILKIKTEFPRILVHGSAGPILDIDAKAINKKEDSINNRVIDEINQIKPDLLFIAFGSPKQEKWYALHEAELHTRGVMVVGGSLDYYSGRKKTPPAIFEKLGLEWIWRLLREKGHLKRVMTAVIIFPLLVFKEAYPKKY